MPSLLLPSLPVSPAAPTRQLNQLSLEALAVAPHTPGQSGYVSELLSQLYTKNYFVYSTTASPAAVWTMHRCYYHKFNTLMMRMALVILQSSKKEAFFGARNGRSLAFPVLIVFT